MEKFFKFITKSVTPFHAVMAIEEILKNQGFTYLDEFSPWQLKRGGNYYTIKDKTSLIAFKIGLKSHSTRYNIVASHLDSPNLKIKPNGLIDGKNFTSLNVEVYGGPIFSTWFDRPLSIAGRIILKKGNTFESKNINIDEDLLVIPNMSVHLNPDANSGMKINPQVDLLPLLSEGGRYKTIEAFLSEKLGIKENDIISHDLSVYNRDVPKVIGANQEYFISPRIDNLECAYSSLEGFLEANNEKSINVYASFNNEEVGSMTKQGADSTFLYDTLQRISSVLGESLENFLIAQSNSVIVSADNAHSIHPNHPEKSDPTNNVKMNGGIVLKHNASYRYTTDALSESIMIESCNKAGAAYQHYTNRSDQRGGGTLGAISSSHLSIPSVDIGLAQLAMHSASETAGTKDYQTMIDTLKAFYESNYTCISKNEFEM